MSDISILYYWKFFFKAESGLRESLNQMIFLGRSMLMIHTPYGNYVQTTGHKFVKKKKMKGKCIKVYFTDLWLRGNFTTKSYKS